MASNQGWDKTTPAGASALASGDDNIRAFKAHMEAWWEDEHYGTDGSANSAGVHKHGSARAYVGTTSQLSNPTGDGDGRLFFATDNKGLYVAQGSSSSWSQINDGSVPSKISSIHVGSFTTASITIGVNASIADATAHGLAIPDGSPVAFSWRFGSLSAPGFITNVFLNSDNIQYNVFNASGSTLTIGSAGEELFYTIFARV